MSLTVIKKLAFFVFICLALTPVKAEIALASQSVIPNTETYPLTSKITGRTYQIFISTPLQPAPVGGYPVIYLTDANAYFGTMVETMRHFVRGGKDRTEAVVVGIGYPEGTNIGKARSFFLTIQLADSPVPEGFGGASGFLHFILDELKPQIEDRFTLNKQSQTLFGHSFGGLFTLNALINQPDAFQTYLIASPSIWWGDRFMFRNKNFLSRLSPKLETTGATARVLL